jgi:hypothetical protein
MSVFKDFFIAKETKSGLNFKYYKHRIISNLERNSDESLYFQLSTKIIKNLSQSIQTPVFLHGIMILLTTFLKIRLKKPK